MQQRAEGAKVLIGLSYGRNRHSWTLPPTARRRALPDPCLAPTVGLGQRHHRSAPVTSPRSAANSGRCPPLRLSPSAGPSTAQQRRRKAVTGPRKLHSEVGESICDRHGHLWSPNRSPVAQSIPGRPRAASGGSTRGFATTASRRARCKPACGNAASRGAVRRPGKPPAADASRTTRTSASAPQGASTWSITSGWQTETAADCLGRPYGGPTG